MTVVQIFMLCIKVTIYLYICINCAELSWHTKYLMEICRGCDNWSTNTQINLDVNKSFNQKISSEKEKKKV